MYSREAYLCGLIKAAMDAVISIDENQEIVVFNPAAEKIFGYKESEIVGHPLSRIIPPRYHEIHQHQVAKFSKEGISNRSMNNMGELVGIRKSGEEFYLEASISKIDVNGKSVLTAILRDVTERRQMLLALQESEARMKEIFENLSSGVAVYLPSQDGSAFRFTGYNKAAERLDQISRSEVIGRDLTEVFPGAGEFGFVEALRKVWETGRPVHFPLSFYKDGRISGWRDNYIYKLSNGEVVAIYEDLTKEKQQEEKLRELAHHDQLTGLPNRSLLSDRIQQAISTAKRDSQLIAILFVDLDKFKPVNDEYGHSVGDLLLKAVTKRMKECIRESDTISRVGGDEFVFVLPNIESEDNALLVAKKVLNVVSAPFEVFDHEIRISASIGVAIYPWHGTEEKSLMIKADEAMYSAKKSGSNNVSIWEN